MEGRTNKEAGWEERGKRGGDDKEEQPKKGVRERNGGRKK